MSDAEDAKRWRAIRKLLHVSWSRNEWWEIVSERGNRRTEEKREDWFWQLILYDENAELCGTVDSHAKVPSVDQAIDLFLSEHPGDEERP